MDSDLSGALLQLELATKRSWERCVPSVRLAQFLPHAPLLLKYFLACTQRGALCPLLLFRGERETLYPFLITLLECDALEHAETALAARLALGLSRKDFAKLCGVSVPTLARVERGELSPSLETYEKIVKVLGLRVRVRPSNRNTDGQN
jgi:DNA-binding XRE family transcriptional regulator